MVCRAAWVRLRGCSHRLPVRCSAATRILHRIQEDSSRDSALSTFPAGASFWRSSPDGVDWHGQLHVLAVPAFPSASVGSATLAVVCSQLSLLMIHRRLTQEDYRWWWLSYCYGAFMSFCFDAFRIWTDCEDQPRSACGVAFLGSLQSALIAGSTSFLINLRMMLYVYSKLVCDDV